MEYSRHCVVVTSKRLRNVWSYNLIIIFKTFQNRKLNIIYMIKVRSEILITLCWSTQWRRWWIMGDIRKIQSILLCAVISCLRTRDKSSRRRTRKHNFFFYPAIRRNRKIVSLIVGKRVIIYMRREVIKPDLDALGTIYDHNIRIICV